jgi:hypothetical protein
MRHSVPVQAGALLRQPQKLPAQQAEHVIYLNQCNVCKHKSMHFELDTLW